jgi:microcystin degradation protein MlrC
LAPSLLTIEEFPLKIFAGGIATETNTFSSIPTELKYWTVVRAKDGKPKAPVFDLDGTWGRLAREGGHDYIFSLMAYAAPAGKTPKADYEKLRDEMLRELRAAMPVDIALLMLHGAMVAEGYDDCEEDVARRAREIVGPDAVIGVELDLHCHLRDALLDSADLVVIYKEYPHVDVNVLAERLFDLAVATKEGRIKPKMALFDCRMIGLYPTTVQPMRAFVDAMNAAESRPGILSLSFGHGFQFADVPHIGAKMLAIADGDIELARQTAQEFGMKVYGLRREIAVDRTALSLEAALSRAVASSKKPVVVADQSDNPGGGAPSDATFALRWLVDHGIDNVGMAIFHDPEVVRQAKAVGNGARIRVKLGGKSGAVSGQPVELEATVLALQDDCRHAFPQEGGGSVTSPVGDAAALRAGGIDIIVGSVRCQCYAPSIFEDLGIDPKSKLILVVKSTQHFYGAFKPIAGEVLYMAAPGAVPPDPRLVSYTRVDTGRLYPWNDDPMAAG